MAASISCWLCCTACGNWTHQCVCAYTWLVHTQPNVVCAIIQHFHSSVLCRNAIERPSGNLKCLRHLEHSACCNLLCLKHGQPLACASVFTVAAWKFLCNALVMSCNLSVHSKVGILKCAVFAMSTSDVMNCLICTWRVSVHCLCL